MGKISPSDIRRAYKRMTERLPIDLMRIVFEYTIDITIDGIPYDKKYVIPEMLSGAKSIIFTRGFKIKNPISLTNLRYLSGVPTIETKSLAKLFMFSNIDEFNDLNDWDVSNVVNMQHMFYGAKSSKFNVSSWNVSNVKNMYAMFCGSELFNCDLSRWDVSNVVDMRCMFSHAEIFNCDLSRWDVSNVVDMYAMFYNASAFNSDLNGWNIDNVRIVDIMFENATSMTVVPHWYH